MVVPVNEERVAQLEMELAQARAQLLQEDGERFRILMREISPEEKQRILDGLTDKQERILFGLELPDEPKRRGRKPGTGGERPAKSGGDQVCPICGKAGLTERGLRLHITRMHKGEGKEEATG